jgi:hypothetical protein
MKIRIKIRRILFFIILTVFISCNNESFNYKVKEYTLTIEPMKNGKDVYVSIDLTYLIENSGSKSNGFKFAGNGIVDSLICTDEKGIIRGEVEYLRETKISWYFDPVQSGVKQIKAKFILRNFIINKENNESEIYIPWAGVFRVPVEQAKYILVVQDYYSSVEFEEPKNWEKQNLNGTIYFTNFQTQLENKVIKVQFTNL